MVFSTGSQGPRRLGFSWLLAVAFLLGTMSATGAFAAAVIRSEDIVDGEVKRVDLAGDAVVSAKVADGSIKGADLASTKWVPVAPAMEGDACGAGYVARFCGPTVMDNFHWGNFGGGWQTVRFRRDVTGMVTIEGVARGSFSFRTAFVLPNGFRPQNAHAFPVSCANTNDPFQYVAGRVSVYADGRVHWEPGDTCNPYTYISFDGIRFATD